MRIATIIGFFLALLAVTCKTASADFYVAPTGNDSQPGTQQQPFRTLDRARNAVREQIKRFKTTGKKRTPITIWIAGGAYYCDHTFE